MAINDSKEDLDDTRKKRLHATTFVMGRYSPYRTMLDWELANLQVLKYAHRLVTYKVMMEMGPL